MATYRVQLVGEMWWPMGVPAATERTFQAEDDEDAIAKVDFEAGDFSTLLGFRLSTPGCRHDQREIEDWSTLSDQHSAEEIEMLFFDCMYPSEGDA